MGKSKVYDILMGISTQGATSINVSYDEGRQFVKKAFEMPVLFSKVTLLENIKSGDLVPLLNIVPDLKAKSCGYTDDQSISMTDVVMNTKLLGADLTLCWNTLVGTTWERYLPAGSVIEDVADLKEAIINYLSERYAKAMQDMALVGQNGNHSIDGLITKAYAQNSGVVSVTGSTPTTANAMDLLFAIYESMPASILSSNNRPIIIVGTDWLKKASIQSYNDNRMAFNVVIDEENGFQLPTTNVRVQGFDALNSTNKALAGSADHMFVGTDLRDELTTLRAWWSEDNLEFRTSFRARLGTALAFTSDMRKYEVE